MTRHRRIWPAFWGVLILLGAAASAAAAPPPTGLFTSPPTDLGNIAGIVPLGSLSPGSGHILPVDHMYIAYPNPFNGGADSYPVYAMAGGEVVLVGRTWRDDLSSFDYELYIQHTATITSQFDHLHDLSAALLSHLGSIPDAWIELSDTTDIMFLGQFGAPAPFPVVAGEQVGITRSFFFSWDVGVIDLSVHRWFAGHGPRRYPTLRQFARLLGLEIRQAPYPGDRTLNAGCFLDYLTPALRAVWFAQLLSTPQDCGRPDWDLPNRLRGSWFNAAVDEAAEPPLFELELAALSIVPDNFRPLTHLQIGAGSGHPLAGLDPDGLYPQLDNRFLVTVDSTPGARINPDPAQVSVETGLVCYDMEYPGGGLYNTLLVKMTGPRDILLKYDPTDYAAPHCPVAILTEPDAWTAHYVR